MTSAQLLHDKIKRAYRELLTDPALSKRNRRIAEQKLAEALEYERVNPWIVPA